MALPSWLPKDRSLQTLSDDDGWATKTSQEQRETETVVMRAYNVCAWSASSAPKLSTATGEAGNGSGLVLRRDKHTAYLTSCLKALPVSYQSLDASQPWVVFWIVNSLAILGTLKDVGEGVLLALVARLEMCQSATGGFGGGYLQLPHLAPSYAATAALLTIAAHLPEQRRLRAYRMVDRSKMIQFIRSLHQPDGSYTMHHDGESDVRASYCAVAIARMLNLLPHAPDLADDVAEYIKECQDSSIEGVPGGEAGNEGHGGYAYCALAATVLLGKAHLLNLDILEQWAVRRQMRVEGGFSGRTNKLVDCCYSFWTGGIFPLIDSGRAIPGMEHPSQDDPDGPLGFDQCALQSYIMGCCQHPNGGLVDKPGKGRDLYHTCYGLSGLSVAQTGGIVAGDLTNVVEKTVVELNIVQTARDLAALYFTSDRRLDE